ncbi:MAG: hypothetical protein WBA74_17200 [Cyclobacteriaceae bacterium]
MFTKIIDLYYNNKHIREIVNEREYDIIQEMFLSTQSNTIPAVAITTHKKKILDIKDKYGNTLIYYCMTNKNFNLLDTYINMYDPNGNLLY